MSFIHIGDYGRGDQRLQRVFYNCQGIWESVSITSLTKPLHKNDHITLAVLGQPHYNGLQDVFLWSSAVKEKKFCEHHVTLFANLSEHSVCKVNSLFLQ